MKTHTQTISLVGTTPYPRHPGWHRRDAARAPRVAAFDPPLARPPRAHCGAYRAELCSQGGHRHGGRARATARRAGVECGRGAVALWAQHEPAGAAQPDAGTGAGRRRAGGKLACAARRRHQRLGRRVTADARLCKSRQVRGVGRVSDCTASNASAGMLRGAAMAGRCGRQGKWAIADACRARQRALKRLSRSFGRVGLQHRLASPFVRSHSRGPAGCQPTDLPPVLRLERSAPSPTPLPPHSPPHTQALASRRQACGCDGGRGV
eukprot:349582-Chlamydomonas_euryale.AAC.2